ncbi:alpha/beta hydrolase [Streptomyces hyaluromycini]|uniref:alpha/beta hydrolase n=1 Tax=Streptomyces hyaluromycini TaxID=1377993 RepID=UPI000B5CBF51|nr:alpha/beta fold hydrolase [Streptomyces hyaluromycini]
MKLSSEQDSARASAAPGTENIVLDAGGTALSGLLARPARPTPHAVVVAVHGSGMRAGYFDSRARAGLSLLATGAQLGYTVLALDRPGYGLSARQLPHGLALAQQTQVLHAALASFARSHATGAGFFVVGHSHGGKLALAAAAHADGAGLIGVDVSGIGTRLAVTPDQLPGAAGPGDWRRHWGPLRLYPPGAFRLGHTLVAPVPAAEAREASAWPRTYLHLAARIRIPVRFTFAEQERWWRHDDEAVAELLRPLAAPKSKVDRLPDAGHNISLGWAARTYHLRVLAFLEECLLASEAAPAGPVRNVPPARLGMS